jgi:glycosyltransferase involved in cell wall biosynthesis
MLETRRLSVIAPVRYPWKFNGPRNSIHNIYVRSFIPFNRISRKLDGVTIFNPVIRRKADLIHAFNRIPIGPTPFVISFESHLPRAFGLENTAYYRFLTQKLAAADCRKIICISEHARGIFFKMHRENPMLPILRKKLLLRYPNIPVPTEDDAMADTPLLPLAITFIGNHFGRKGGCVAVKLAELAHQNGFPLIVNIVSSLEAGGGVWTDPPEESFFDQYFRLLSLPNVRHNLKLSNADVLGLLKRSHFSLLTTFADTFGYSAIESMINHTPVIGTSQGALPEFIRDRENGILLKLPVDETGEWLYAAPQSERASNRFKRLYADEIERLAAETFSALVSVVNEPGKLASLRRAARADALRLFNENDAAQFWDDLYVEAVDAEA